MSDPATTCNWCMTPNDATSVPVGKFDVPFHQACIARAERESIACRRLRAAELEAEVEAWRQRRLAAVSGREADRG